MSLAEVGEHVEDTIVTTSSGHSLCATCGQGGAAVQLEKIGKQIQQTSRARHQAPVQNAPMSTPANAMAPPIKAKRQTVRVCRYVA